MFGSGARQKMYDGKMEAYIFLAYVSLSNACCGPNSGVWEQYRARKHATVPSVGSLLARSVLFPFFSWSKLCGLNQKTKGGTDLNLFHPWLF
jgi:hypothetical protein